MDINELRERPSAATVTVTELNNIIKNIFDSSRLLSAVTVSGEISNFKRHSSGHLYFSLKDDGGQIRAVMFRSRADHIKFIPENGMRVIVHGSVTVYPRDGSYQIYVSSMQPDGVGALYLAYEQLKARLEEEGLFSEEHKKPIPEYPMNIGVITSPTGAAVRDIINVTGRRFPLATVYIYPALVQGDGAVDSLVGALEYFESSSLVDVIIIGRGGGSIEDLWGFNSEKLARAIFKAKTPIISAVGHETDFTICDFVADLRAPTPSAAAEIAVPDMRSLLMTLDDLNERSSAGLLRLCARKREAMESLADSPVFRDPTALITHYRDQLSEAFEDFCRTFSADLKDARSEFSAVVGRLNALSPLSVLSRGYSVTTLNNRPLTDADNLSVGDEIESRLMSGRVRSTVTEIL